VAKQNVDSDWHTSILNLNCALPNPDYNCGSHIVDLIVTGRRAKGSVTEVGSV
jgi:hypothetical protein